MVVLKAVQILTYCFFWVIVMPDQKPMKIPICNMNDLFILADIVSLLCSAWKPEGDEVATIHLYIYDCSDFVSAAQV
jgi:hypothetical protein